MSYFNVLGLRAEPFSTSPDPDFFYHSLSHETALKRLEIAIRLKRGLSIIWGEVGIGKTTLCRLTAQAFVEDEDFVFHLMLDPGFKTEEEFLAGLVDIFGVPCEARSPAAYKSCLKRYLFRQGVEEQKTVVLLIDEGQKFIPDNLEVLRMLLNYETNEFKLLQLVIFSQLELRPKIEKIHNFMDRVSMQYTIMPLCENETREMIAFRLESAGLKKNSRIFSDEALSLIYAYSSGYPRRISMICHDALEQLIIRDKGLVDAEMIREIMNRR
ncbi:MAG: AAA family ATPase [Candidatus Omnitrophica bacterium]|nr:AAA family ATPase [Candidatus Omnitrophota bacterium]